MMSVLTYITGFFMNFELLSIFARHIFGREPSNDYFIKILFLLSKWFQTRRFLWEFPIGSYVKLTSAVAAILVGVPNLKCISIMMSFLTYITGFLMDFELLPILTDYAN
jgi:hypothetical protein